MNIYETPQHYHVMNRGAAQQAIFLTQGQAQLFLALALQFSRRYRVAINAYCLMHDHFHLVVYANKRGLALFMQSLQSTYAHAFNAKIKHSGPVFQGCYTWRLIETERYLQRVIDYVHQNPKACGYEESLEKYPWSSLSDKRFLALMRKPRVTTTQTL